MADDALINALETVVYRAGWRDAIDAALAAIEVVRNEWQTEADRALKSGHIDDVTHFFLTQHGAKKAAEAVEALRSSLDQAPEG